MKILFIVAFSFLAPLIANSCYTEPNFDIVKIQEENWQRILEHMHREFCALRWGPINVALYAQFVDEIAEYRIDLKDIGVTDYDVGVIYSRYGSSR